MIWVFFFNGFTEMCSMIILNAGCLGHLHLAHLASDELQPHEYIIFKCKKWTRFIYLIL